MTARLSVPQPAVVAGAPDAESTTSQGRLAFSRVLRLYVHSRRKATDYVPALVPLRLAAFPPLTIVATILRSASAENPSAVQDKAVLWVLQGHVRWNPSRSTDAKVR